MEGYINLLSFIALFIVIVSLKFNKKYLFYILMGLVLLFIFYLFFSQDKLKITGIEEHVYHFESGSFAIEDTTTNTYSIYTQDSVKIKKGTFGQRGEFFEENEGYKLLREMVYFELILLLVYFIFYFYKDFIVIRDFIKRKRIKN